MIDKQREKREDLLLRLENVIVDNPISMARLALQIGLAYNTLKSFMAGSRFTSMEALARIEKYLLEKEGD